jgi:3-mercaptopyruvate sulfurtransferase SseA
MRSVLGAVAIVIALASAALANHPTMGAVLTIDPASLQRLASGGRMVAVIDLRPTDAYRSGRVPGARSIPLTALIPRHGEVPADSLVVLYGAQTVDEAAPAYRYLRATGYANVFVLEGGFWGWQAHGYSVER